MQYMYIWICWHRFVSIQSIFTKNGNSLRMQLDWIQKIWKNEGLLNSIYFISILESPFSISTHFFFSFLNIINCFVHGVSEFQFKFKYCLSFRCSFSPLVISTRMYDIKIGTIWKGIFYFDCISHPCCYFSSLFVMTSKLGFQLPLEKGYQSRSDIQLLPLLKKIWFHIFSIDTNMYRLYNHYTRFTQSHILLLASSSHIMFQWQALFRCQIDDADFCCGWRANWIFRLQIIKLHFNDFYWLHVARVTIEQQNSRYIESLIKFVITINISIWVSVVTVIAYSYQAFNLHTNTSIHTNYNVINENNFWYR